MLLLALVAVLNTFSATFEREVTEHGCQDTTRGEVYYQAPGKVFIDVATPINQVMVVTANLLTIYYPNERKAFRIKTERSIPLPFIQAVIGMMQEDYGLTQQGFRFLRHEARGDTLYTSWDPPEDRKKALGRFVLGSVVEKLVYVQAERPDGKVAVRSFYDDHVRWEGKLIPLKVLSEAYDASGSLQQRETLVYTNVVFNPVIQDRIVHFTIPDSVSVKEMEW